MKFNFKKQLIPIILAALCLLAACSPAQPMTPSKNPENITAKGAVLVQAAYPVMAQYPTETDDWKAYDTALSAWWDSRQEQVAMSDHDSLDGFNRATVLEYLKNADGENRIYSPINLYLALAMLAETTDGNSRAELLSLLGVDSLETLRTRAKAVWIANYCDDGILTTTLSNSLWLKNGMDYVPETLQNLADYYYASAFSGEPGTPEYDKLLQDWLNEQTGGLLTEQVKDITLSPETVLALASAIYFKGGWTDSFNQTATAPDTFHGINGDQTVDFMHRTTDGDSVFFSEGFVAYPLQIEAGGTMWLILPDEDKSIDDVLVSGDVFSVIEWNENAYESMRFDKVNLNLPKFDVDSTTNLIPGLKNLGINDVFNPIASNFSPLTTQFDNLFVSEATHSARVKVDEEGCEAAAFTVMIVAKYAPSLGTTEYTLTLDRPFLFALTGLTGDLLFMGVVNQP